MAYKLFGNDNGTERAFLLSEGEHLVGSESQCTIVLTHNGVSRRHAMVHVHSDSVEITDQQSKNGVWVNGNRISSASLRSGDIIGFGPVSLQISRVDDDDADLAISKEITPVVVDRSSPTRTSIPLSSPQPADLDLICRLCALILKPDIADVPKALQLLRIEMNATAAGLYETGPSGEQIAHFLCGDPATLPESIPTSGSDTCFAAIQGAFALVIVGTPDATRKSLAQHILQLIVHAHFQRSLPRMFPAENKTLVFPENHVRGASPAMRAVYEELKLLVKGTLPVLITGETGVGKEHVAHILHQSSERRQGLFIAVNCAAIPQDLLEAELFGIEKGVATGVDARIGKLEAASGGTLFLDEVGDMAPSLQAKMLRTLQEKEVHPVGAFSPKPIDIRVISATNLGPSHLIESGFRRDLYYRLAGYTIRVPTLGERPEDIPALVDRFVDLFAEEIDKKIRGVTVKALQKLIAAPWPGNVRELEHEVRRLVYRCPNGATIDSSMLSPIDESVVPIINDDGTIDLKGQVDELERRLLQVALGASGGNKSEAARRLGLTRNGLALKMARLEINGD